MIIYIIILIKLSNSLRDIHKLLSNIESKYTFTSCNIKGIYTNASIIIFEQYDTHNLKTSFWIMSWDDLYFVENSASLRLI